MWKKIIFISISLLGFALAGGGNPEVKVINQCFKLKGDKQTHCLNIFYPGDINITIYPPTSKSIKLAGRKSSIERGTFNLKGQKRFILSVDTSNAKLPISCNINTAKKITDGSNLVIDIAVKDIKKQITLKDRDGKLLLVYTIRK